MKPGGIALGHLLLQPDRPEESLDVLFDAIREQYAFSAVVYLSPSFNDCSIFAPFSIFSTGSPLARPPRKAVSAKLLAFVTRITAGRFGPVDWATLRPLIDTPCECVGLSEIKRSRQGLATMVRGPDNSVWAVLLATSNASDAGWALESAERRTDFLMLAQCIHARAWARNSAVSAQSLAITGLTPRQIEILRLLSAGRSIEAIAQMLNISVAASNNHLARACKTLGVRTRVEAMVIAIRDGII